MKKMRKIFAVLLTLAMVLGMSMTAFATEVGTKVDGTASLTVNGLVPGEETTVIIQAKDPNDPTRIKEYSVTINYIKVIFKCFFTAHRIFYSYASAN